MPRRTTFHLYRGLALRGENATLRDAVGQEVVDIPTIYCGTKLGRYEIRSKIGEGGMGEVYLARDTKLDRKVALLKSKLSGAEVAK